MDVAGCVNCGRSPANSRYHIHLAGRQVVEADLCRRCYRRFADADWATVIP